MRMGVYLTTVMSVSVPTITNVEMLKPCAGSPFNCLVSVRAALFIAPLKVKYISY